VRDRSHLCSITSALLSFALLAHQRGMAAAPTAAPIVLTGADRRPAISLNGEWGSIVDPYFFRTVQAFITRRRPTDGFSTRRPNPAIHSRPNMTLPRRPSFKVPSDWNTQRRVLFFYEGPIWYEHDFTYQPKEHARLYLHVGAANYRSWFWVNGKKVCEHEGGYTSFKLRSDFRSSRRR